MSEAGPSSFSRRLSTGEFTDDEDSNIPLRDIRDAEFARLEAGPVAKDVEVEGQQARRWPLWFQSKPRQQSSTGYAKVDEEESAVADLLPPSSPNPKQNRNGSSGICGGKKWWGILYACPPQHLQIEAY